MSEIEGRTQSAGAAASLRTVEPESPGLPDNVTVLPGSGRGEHLRILEAILFAAGEPMDEETLAARLPDGADAAALLADLSAFYARRGVNLVHVAGKWSFRTADDLAFLMRREAIEQKRLSRAALETLAIIAYHQPVTRAEIEEVRGVAVNKGTVDVLMEAGWVRLKGRRRTPGRPVTFGTTDEFLSHFGLDTVEDLPGVEELRAAGLLRSELPDGMMPDEAPDGKDDGQMDEDDNDDHIEVEAIGEDEILAEEIADEAFAGGHGPNDDAGDDADHAEEGEPRF